MDQKACVNSIGGTNCFRKKAKLDSQKEKRAPLMRQYIHQSKLPTTKAEEANFELVPKKSKDITFYGIIVSRSYCLFYYNISLLFSHFSNFSPIDSTLFYNQRNAIYSLQQWNTVDFGLRSSFSNFERKGSRWEPYTHLPGNSSGSLVFVAVPKTRVFGQSLASCSHNFLPTGKIWNERQSTLQCWSTRYRHEVIQAVRPRG